MIEPATTPEVTIVPANEASWEGKDVLLGELHVGTQGIFAAAGFTEVSRPTLRRVVMRIDF